MEQPEPADFEERLLESAQAILRALHDEAVMKRRLDKVRADLRALPEELSRAAHDYRTAQAVVSKCVNTHIAFEIELLKANEP